MRASTIPYKNFDNNIRRAEALANLDGYLEDLLENQGKKTIGLFLDFPQQIFDFLGFDGIMKKLEKTLQKEMKVQFQNKGKEYFGQTAKDFVLKIKPQLEKMVLVFEDLGLLMDQTLLEQALIASVSAFEYYLREITVSIIKLNPSIRKRFYSEIKKALEPSKLEDYGQDAKRVQGEIVADLVKLDVNKIKSLFSKLLDVQNIFGDKKTERKFTKILQRRHLIIHRAGITDPKYKKIMKSKKPIDTQIRLSRRIVVNSIKILRAIAKEIENNFK
jgi:hypothetical protein